MRFEEFIKITGGLPVISTEILLAGVSNQVAIKVQISRWEKAGKLIQLKRGIYLLSEDYRKIESYGPYIAAILKKPSYISLEKALEFYGLIPEAVRAYTSVTTKRQGEFSSKVGIFSYQHIKRSLFWGYKSVTVNNQTAFLAYPEKALLDFIYFQRRKITLAYIEELRLQNMEDFDFKKFFVYAKRFGKPRILSAAEMIKEFIRPSLKKEKKP